MLGNTAAGFSAVQGVTHVHGIRLQQHWFESDSGCDTLLQLMQLTPYGLRTMQHSCVLPPNFVAADCQAEACSTAAPGARCVHTDLLQLTVWLSSRGVVGSV
jgi:hypothetical protein